MLFLISPSKTLDFSPVKTDNHTQPSLIEKSKILVDILKQKSPNDLKKLMKISDKLATINADRYQNFHLPFNTKNAKPAILAFKGDVYAGLEATQFDKADMAFAQKHLRILSGLYGLLRPLDLIQAYRLEMGTSLHNGFGKNLYEFWNGDITNAINQEMDEHGDSALINLASKEYFSAVQPEKVKGDVYHINFKENRNGQYKIISFSAKKARGLMCQYIIKNRLTEPEQLKNFDWEQYTFNDTLSSENEFIFTR